MFRGKTLNPKPYSAELRGLRDWGALSGSGLSTWSLRFKVETSEGFWLLHGRSNVEGIRLRDLRVFLSR